MTEETEGELALVFLLIRVVVFVVVMFIEIKAYLQ